MSIAVACFVAVLTAGAEVTYDRKLDYTVDLATHVDVELLAFYQEESVQFDLHVYRDGEPVDLTDPALMPLWIIATATNSEPDVVIRRTGTIESATCCTVTSYVPVVTNSVTNLVAAYSNTQTSRWVRFTLTPSESGMTNVLHDGWVSLQIGEGDGMTSRIIAHRQSINVRATP